MVTPPPVYSPRADAYNSLALLVDPCHYPLVGELGLSGRRQVVG